MQHATLFGVKLLRRRLSVDIVGIVVVTTNILVLWVASPHTIEAERTSYCFCMDGSRHSAIAANFSALNPICVSPNSCHSVVMCAMCCVALSHLLATLFLGKKNFYWKFLTISSSHARFKEAKRSCASFSASKSTISTSS